jgi:hypothetical protein
VVPTASALPNSGIRKLPSGKKRRLGESEA